MNATLTSTATLNPTKALDFRASLDRLKARVRGLVAEAEGRVGRLSKVQRVAAVFVLAALLLSVAGLT